MCLSRPYQTPLNLARGVYNLTAIHNLEAIELLLVNHNFPLLYCCNARHEYQTGEDVLDVIVIGIASRIRLLFVILDSIK